MKVGVAKVAAAPNHDRPEQQLLLDDDRARYGTDVANRSLTVFDAGDEIRVRAGDEGMRFLLVSGAPIKEPIAWRGPVVMNTQEEIAQAFAQLRAGTFLDIR